MQPLCALERTPDGSVRTDLGNSFDFFEVIRKGFRRNTQIYTQKTWEPFRSPDEFLKFGIRVRVLSRGADKDQPKMVHYRDMT